MESDGKVDGGANQADRFERLMITPEVLSLIAELDEFKGAWRAIGSLEPERLASLRRMAKLESVGSSTRIEGAKLSDREVGELLARMEVRLFATRDEQEVAGYAEVMQIIFDGFESIDLTENHIQQLHRDLLKHSEKDDRHRGAYKTLPNHVEAFAPDGSSLGVVFETASPFDTPEQMRVLVEWAHRKLKVGDLHPLLVIAVFTVSFLGIHPFHDGNGRLSRALTTLLLLRSGYAFVPYSSLESVIEQSKEDYYLALRTTQITIGHDQPEWEPWTIYFLRAIQRQKDRLATKIELEHSVIGTLPALSVAILDFAQTVGRVSVAEAAKFTGASRNTIKDHLTRLVRAGQLVRHGAGRGTWYSRG